MALCVRCQKNIGFVGSLTTFNQASQRCGDCHKFVKAELNKIRETFLNFCKTGNISHQSFRTLYSLVQQQGLDWGEALAYISNDSLRLLERYLAFAASDGIISEEEEKYFDWLCTSLNIPPNLSKPIVERLNHLKLISGIREGKLPTIEASTHLESDEICHLEIPSTYHKINRQSVRRIQGRIIVTNKKIHFLSSDGSWTIQFKNVMRVKPEFKGVYLELATKSGNGFYNVGDPLITEAIVTTLTRMSKRQLLAFQIDDPTRHIPQEVKIAVWQRDLGKCVQCGSNSYLEFDHIIPFSKGGASTFNNCQLLCRRCNLSKGNRI